tara:strand:- start:896 stop:1846 length:951 start_codon:yes stop_codon:yes gene_type:complete
MLKINHNTLLMNIEYIKKNIPNIELSYDFINHNKVYDLFIAVPFGKKYILWFTYFNHNNVCLLIQVNHKTKELLSFEVITVAYNHLLLGTILYGTIIHHDDVKFFLTENIIYYTNHYVNKKSFNSKLSLLEDVFSNINNNIYSTCQTVIGSCIMNSNKEKLIESLRFLNYNIFCILSKNTTNNSTRVTLFNNDNHNVTAIFQIKPEINTDTYTLYIHGSNGIIPYQKAFIPDYKTSVFMNKHFRIIKENDNLDLLEESDDEDEFENIDEDKYVFLEKTYNFECKYNTRFKKWIPFKKTNIKKITNYSNLRQYTQQK